jgi:hypothetical protein
VTRVRKQFGAGPREPFGALLAFLARMAVRAMAAMDGDRMDRRSAQLQTFGWHVIAVKSAAT